MLIFAMPTISNGLARSEITFKVFVPSVADGARGEGRDSDAHARARPVRRAVPVARLGQKARKVLRWREGGRGTQLLQRLLLLLPLPLLLLRASGPPLLCLRPCL